MIGIGRLPLRVRPLFATRAVAAAARETNIFDSPFPVVVYEKSNNTRKPPGPKPGGESRPALPPHPVIIPPGERKRRSAYGGNAQHTHTRAHIYKIVKFPNFFSKITLMDRRVY